MSDEPSPTIGDIRISPSGEVEHYDGTTWKRVRRLPEEGQVVFRSTTSLTPAPEGDTGRPPQEGT
ncbi:hypothetical protein BKA00_005783 [Actinomadura coerulea]|uniref:Uncharacterized protein n=1 Tax=Actinomadura coerulea TaxID=46159 RepID=A0A7X0L250_9ACTN|nr:hypothetical protein [Actinomadura coerulea]MBB6398869.1 hypothetical protein [Actinomadura coerulea]GGP98637.1 hypothetical protein GCM10010187_12860 [Actinomadura coerulea]